MVFTKHLKWSVAVATLTALRASAAPSINVGMTAAFSGGPYLVELLETAASENASSYFPLLDRIASGHFTAIESDSELYERFLNTLRQDGHLRSSEAISTFNLALSLRTAAPRVEAQYQYYSTAVEPLLPDTSLTPSCPSWVQLEGSIYCDSTLGTPIFSELPIHPDELPYDRVTGTGRDAILYADPCSPSFPSFHLALRKSAKAGEHSYRLRYRPQRNVNRSALHVSGYGVELALKRTDYIVIDDREAADHDSPQKAESGDVHLGEDEDVADLKPLSTSELAPIGMKAASFILQSEDPLQTLVKLTQDFPKYSASLVNYDVSVDFATEYEDNRILRVPPGLNLVWMNGVQLIERQIQPFTLLEMIRRERKLIDSVRSLGFNGNEAVSLLGHRAIASAKSESAAARYDWTDRLEDGRVIIWLNDMENDPFYADFPRTLSSLMQRGYPGQLPPIARNIFHAVLPIDLSNPDEVNTISRLMMMISRGITIRFGLVPVVSSDEAAKHTKIAYHLLENYGRYAFQAYISAILGEPGKAHEQVLSEVLDQSELLEDGDRLSYSQVLEAASGEEHIHLARHWADRLTPGSNPPVVFANGVSLSRESNWMQPLMQQLAGDLQEIQLGIYHGYIDEDMWIPALFLEGAMSKRNAYIAPENSKALRVVDMSKLLEDHSNLFEAIPILEHHHESTKEDWAALTMIADLTEESCIFQLLSAIQFKANNPGVRLDIVHNPAPSAKASALNSAIKTNEKSLAETDALDGLKALLATAGDEKSEFDDALDAFLTAIKVPRGATVLMLNGRVIGPISSKMPFHEDDFQQLLNFEQKSRILPVYHALDDLGLSDKLTGPLAAAKITSTTALSTISDLPEGIFESAPPARSTMYESWGSKHSAIKVGDPETASVHIVGSLNPVSEQGQRWAPLLKVLSELDGVYMMLFINPRDRIEELPVTRFYRYVLESKPSFDANGSVKAMGARFSGLPSEALLTTAMDVPPAWLVAPKVSLHDLDNIKLSSVKGNVDATYELEHILVEGHSREGRGKPPRGAQLVLGTEANTHLTDTIITANLGYFQFKANPGFYDIRLMDGRSADVYDIVSIGAQGWEAIPGDEGTQVALMDFQGATLYPRLKRKPGMDEAEVLEKWDDADDSIVAKGIKFAGSLFGSGEKGNKALSSAEVHADINIFSVASGHLYERMLNIMMVSVMRHTKHTVKFWFIEQFLSPSFKDFIPHLAEAYGFKYEMVTFKWPHWLRQQKEKQREIWGYKILFLDVLFPLSLDKVIFVDADQIVRTDMMDLVRHDLEGAPYGFTPMGDSRTEMEGFRFWKQGYWANYLRGKPYHISALYVVDLRRFRELAAGDRLRQQYHALSADPNSLSNLDQDLPNHMQPHIPIHSLPSEWLWCETWCADDELATARTIDLCNNPLTKEPKLDRARRQVPEWTVYDEEIAEVDRKRKLAAGLLSGGGDPSGDNGAPDDAGGTEAEKGSHDEL